uniref:Uncharacterized protein n=1 Tax=Rhizophora mucronata TaxID=61149 RepID=A0A2P2P3V8_RHIMU
MALGVASQKNVRINTRECFFFRLFDNDNLVWIVVSFLPFFFYVSFSISRRVEG